MDWQVKARWTAECRHGKLIATSSGVSAGMDLAVWLGSQLQGEGAGEAAANRAEYVPCLDPQQDSFAARL